MKSIVIQITGLLLYVFCCAGVLSAAELPTIEHLAEQRDELAAPSRLAVDGSGNFYIADRREKAVLHFDPTGIYQGRFDSAPVSGAGLDVSDDGQYLFVAAKHNVNIVATDSGEVVGRLGAEDEFSKVGAIDIDADGRIFVADSGERVIKVYLLQSSEGGLLGQLQYSFGQGQLASIFAMAIDRINGRVYVADCIRTVSVLAKVQVFDLDGFWQQAMYFDSAFGGEALGFVGDIGFDDAGRVFFADKKTGNLRVLDTAGQPLGDLLSVGHAAGELWQPRGLAYIAGSEPGVGRLLVANSDGRISIFGLDGAQLPSTEPDNTPPPIPAPLSPAEGSQVAVNLPSFSFGSVEDEDGDQVSYQLQVYSGEQLIEELTVPAGADPLVTSTVPLTENGSYHWQVQAFDGTDVSGYSAAQNFYVNAVEDSPSSPELLLPLDEDNFASDGQFSWSEAADPDPFSSLHYRLQVSFDADFSQLQADLSLDATEYDLNQLPCFDLLVPGQRYWWRVLAEDEIGLLSANGVSRSFVYDSTQLNLTANFTGAQVYLGGNYGYYGSYLGETPLSLNDLPAGNLTLVFSAPGFDPQVVQIDLPAREVTDYYVDLKPALLAGRYQLRPLYDDLGVKLQADGGGAPFAVDWDNDGGTDLLVGEGNGKLVLYRNTSDGDFRYDTGQTLETPLIVGASPFVVDWDNDGRKDLLVGSADGTLTLLLNNGSDQAPLFGAGQFLETSLGVVAVGGSAAPWVTDWDDDGRKDLLVGSAEGELFLLRNIGSDAVVELAEPVSLLQCGESVAPVVADWDGDGSAELLLALPGRLVSTVRDEGGLPQLDQTLFALPGGWHKQPEKISELRFFIHNLNGAGPKDLLFGNANGDLFFGRSVGGSPVPALRNLLEAKISRLSELAGRRWAPFVGRIDHELSRSRMNRVRKLMALLARRAKGELAVEAAELKALLH